MRGVHTAACVHVQGGGESQAWRQWLSKYRGFTVSLSHQCLPFQPFESLLQKHNQNTECFLEENEPSFTLYLFRIIFKEVLLFTVHWQVIARHTKLNTVLKMSVERTRVITEAQR